ncbi:MAG TPA: glycosyltransferase family 4 protein [Thermoanaerobaculia bacterium]|nr:glycosyltransferase family 4 protein [Thermoanaerobaculia bacterium]
MTYSGALRQRILVLIEYYLPGYRGGGTIRSLANLIDSMGDELEFFVLTTDRDWRSATPYPGIVRGQWQPVGKAMVRYLAPRERSFRRLGQIIRDTPHDLLYFSSVFTPRSTILPLLLRRLGRIGDRPVVLGPRGEFSPGAIRIRGLKKRTYLRVAKALGFFRGVVWQASTELEREDIRREISPDAEIVEAIDFSPSYENWTQGVSRTPKQPGAARLCFVSRISPKKNLLFALELLRGIPAPVTLDIYGPVEAGHWAECEAVIATLPANVRATSHGPVSYADLGPLLAQYDLFLFPTLGENFGHTIVEALAAGCPVLVSDQTPWRELQAAGVGWDLPLDGPDAFRRAIGEIIAMPEAAHAEMRRKAREFALRVSDPRPAIEENRALFQHALQRTRR